VAWETEIPGSADAPVWASYPPEALRVRATVTGLSGNLVEVTTPFAAGAVVTFHANPGGPGVLALTDGEAYQIVARNVDDGLVQLADAAGEVKQLQQLYEPEIVLGWLRCHVTGSTAGVTAEVQGFAQLQLPGTTLALASGDPVVFLVESLTCLPAGHTAAAATLFARPVADTVTGADGVTVVTLHQTAAEAASGESPIDFEPITAGDVCGEILRPNVSSVPSNSRRLSDGEIIVASHAAEGCTDAGTFVRAVTHTSFSDAAGSCICQDYATATGEVATRSISFCCEGTGVSLQMFDAVGCTGSFAGQETMENRAVAGLFNGECVETSAAGSTVFLKMSAAVPDTLRMRCLQSVFDVGSTAGLLWRAPTLTQACADEEDGSWADAFGRGCKAWTGLDCPRQAWQMRMSEDDTRDLLYACPRSCRLCGSPRSSLQVVVATFGSDGTRYSVGDQVVSSALATQARQPHLAPRKNGFVALWQETRYDFGGASELLVLQQFSTNGDPDGSPVVSLAGSSGSVETMSLAVMPGAKEAVVVAWTASGGGHLAVFSMEADDYGSHVLRYQALPPASSITTTDTTAGIRLTAVHQAERKQYAVCDRAEYLEYTAEVVRASPDLEKSQCVGICDQLDECVSVVVLPWEHQQVANDQYFFHSPCLFSTACTRAVADRQAVTPAWYKEDDSGAEAPVVSQIRSLRLVFDDVFEVVSETEAEVAETEAEAAEAQVVSAATSSIVVWQTAEGADGSGHGLRGRMLDAAGDAKEEAFEINTDTEGDQLWAAAAALVDGRYVVVWQTGGDLDAGTNFSVVGRQFGDTSGPEVRGYSLIISPENLDLSQLPETTLVSISEAVWDAARTNAGLPTGFQLGMLRIERTSAGTSLLLQTVSDPKETEQTYQVGLQLGQIVGREVRRHASVHTAMPESGPCTSSSDMAFGRPVTTSANTPAPQLVDSTSATENDECVVAEGDEASATVDLGAVVPVRIVHLRVPSSAVCEPNTDCTTAITVAVEEGANSHQCTLSSSGATAVFTCPAGAAGQSLVVRAPSVLKLCKIKAYLTACN